MKRLIAIARQNHQDHNFQTKTDVIFDGIFQSSLPTLELQTERLKDEAVSLVGAGIASTEWTCTVATFYIVNNSRIYNTLKSELESAIPKPHEPIGLSEVEKLPYLTACVQESKTYILEFHDHTNDCRHSPCPGTDDSLSAPIKDAEY